MSMAQVCHVSVSDTPNAAIKFWPITLTVQNIGNRGNNTMDDLGVVLIKGCMIAIAILFAVVLTKSALIACGVLMLWLC